MKRILTICCLLIGCVAALSAQGDSIARVTHFSETDGYAQTIAVHALQDRHGYVWLCTWDGLVRYDGYGFRSYKARPGDGCPLRTNRIGTVRELDDERLECTTADSLTCVFNRKTGMFTLTEGNYSDRPRTFKADKDTEDRVKALPQFANAYVRILLKDRQGGIWVDTHSGLYRIWFARKELRPVKSSSAAEQEVRALYIDRQKHTWVADKNGFVRRDGEFLAPDGRLTASPTPFGMKVYCMTEDSRGRIWMGCKPGGLVRLTPLGEKGTVKGEKYAVDRYCHKDGDPYSLSSDNVYALCEDRWQRLWIAAYEGGLNMLDMRTGRDVFVNAGSGLAGWPADDALAKTRCLYITSNQVLVVGTLNGLFTCRLSDGVGKMHFFHNVRRPDDVTSLSNNWVMDVQPLPGGMLAVATGGGGLCMARQDALLTDCICFSSVTTEQGLASDICQTLAFDDRDSCLYIVSRAAVSRLSMRDSAVTNFMRGTLADDFNLLDTKPLLTTDGRLLLGTNQGLLCVAAGSLSKSSFRPAIVFDDVDVDANGKIELSPDERSLTIRFAAIDFNKTVPVVYAYRIEGMMEQWNYTGDPQITLPDIPAGTFTLHLRSTNGDGAWADNDRTVTICRRAAFNETPWAWMLYGLLAAVACMAVALLVRYIRRMQREIRDIRLTSQQRLSVMSDRLQELLSIRESVQRMQTDEEDTRDDEDRRFAEHIKQYVGENISNAELSVADMAAEMAVSRTVLFARMKSVFGTTPNNFLMNRRIDMARQLLAKPGAYVADVAYRCGFSDPKYFSKCFKKIVGKTPKEFMVDFSF